MRYTQIESVHCFNFQECIIADKCAMFDLDGCLIKTKSGKRFYQNKNDWIIYGPSVISKLRNLVRDGYTVLVISNQLGLSKGKTTLSDLEARATGLHDLLRIPMIFYFMAEDDLFRKPRTALLEYLQISKESFYVGDAAGRPKDHSACDFQFALNYGINFQSDSDFFIHADDFSMYDYGFDPRRIPIRNKDVKYTSNKQGMIILMGPPAAGKTYIAKQTGYEIISLDLQKTLSKCKKECVKQLKDLKSVVIDNTHAKESSRRVWIDIAEEFDIPYKLIFIDIPKELALHMNKYRSLYGNKRIPAIAIHCFYKNLETPSDCIKHKFALKDDERIRMFL